MKYKQYDKFKDDYSGIWAIVYIDDSGNDEYIYLVEKVNRLGCQERIWANDKLETVPYEIKLTKI